MTTAREACGGRFFDGRSPRRLGKMGSSQVLLRFGVIKDRAGLPRGTDQRECEAIEPEPAGVAPCQDEKDARDK